MSLTVVTKDALPDLTATVRGIPASFARIAARGWSPDPTLPLGYALIEDDTCVGYISTIHASRRFDGGDWLSCNLHGWAVQPSHRSASLSLFVRMHRDALAAGAVITGFAPGGKPKQIYDAFGYRPLDQGWLTLEPSAADLGPLPDAKASGAHAGLIHDIDGASVRFADRGETRSIDLVAVSPDADPVQLARSYHDLAHKTGATSARLETRLLPDGFDITSFLDLGWHSGRCKLARLTSGPTLAPQALDFMFTEVVLMASPLA